MGTRPSVLAIPFFFPPSSVHTTPPHRHRMDRAYKDLVALRNTLREQYRLTNVYRSIIVQKARALRPGATDYDKAEVKYIERALAQRDFAAPDTAAEVKALRGNFARKSNKAELERLSKKGAGGGGGGGDSSGGESSDDDSDAGARKSRNKKKRELTVTMPIAS